MNLSELNLRSSQMKSKLDMDYTKNRLAIIIGYFGETAQKQMAIEEMSELTKEICKDIRGNKNRDAIKEEMVDVLVMIDQLMIIYRIKPSDVHEIKNRKIQRTWERIWNEKQTD